MGSREVLSLIVKNHYGVLNRVITLFSRRGYNIDTLTVSATNDENISRMTITVEGEEAEINHIIAQTLKLEEVIEVFILEPEKSVLRELLLIKVEANDKTRGKIRDFAEIYRAQIVDLSPKSMILELTGKTATIDAFIKMAEEYNIIEMCRTGLTALAR